MLRTVGGWVNFWIAVAMFITTLLHVCVTQEKRRFFKVFKVAGKIFITTVSKKNVQKKVTKDHGGFHQQSPQRLDD